MKNFLLIIIIIALYAFSTMKNNNVDVHINAPDQVEAGSVVEIELELHKSGLGGFARFRQELPHGVTASPLYPSNMNFSFEDNTINMIWLNLPDDKVIRARYQLIFHEKLKGDLLLDGTFSYIENNRRNSSSATAETVTITPSPGIDEELLVDVNESERIMDVAELPGSNYSGDDTASTPTGVESDIASGEAVNTGTDVASDIVSDDTKVTGTENLSGADLPQPLEAEEGVYYRIQLAAGKKPVDPEEYFREYDFAGDVRTEIHEEWIKYSIGSYYDYKEARNKRDHIWSSAGIDDAFVTAYTCGERITVQEAFMIANR